MKNVFQISLAFAVGLLTGCLGSSDPVTGSKSLTDQVAGKYVRTLETNGVSSYDGKPFTTSLKDTILLIQKDQGFEVQNRYWKRVVSNDVSSSNSKGEYGKGDSYQATFNKIDTTITNPLGGSIKIDVNKGLLFGVDRPKVIFNKIK